MWAVRINSVDIFRSADGCHQKRKKKDSVDGLSQIKIIILQQ